MKKDSLAGYYRVIATCSEKLPFAIEVTVSVCGDSPDGTSMCFTNQILTFYMGGTGSQSNVFNTGAFVPYITDAQVTKPASPPTKIRLKY